MRNKTVADRFTSLENVFMLDIDGKLDDETMKEVLKEIKATIINLLCTNFEIILFGILLIRQMLNIINLISSTKQMNTVIIFL